MCGRGPASVGKASYGPFVDAKTEELRAAHDVLAELYAARLAGALDHMPADRAVLGLFCDLTLAEGLGTDVGDVGCGTGRLTPYLAARGLSPRGIDLSPGMIHVARRDHPGFDFTVADLRELPFGDASLTGVVCWYSLMYLAPSDRPAAFGELARVVKPGGYLVTAFKAGDSEVRRGGRSTGLGVEFDVYWLSPPRDGAPGDRRRLCDRVLGRAPRRGPGGLPAGISARPEILKPTPIRAGEDPQFRKLVDPGYLCTRSGMRVGASRRQPTSGTISSCLLKASLKSSPHCASSYPSGAPVHPTGGKT